MRLYSAKPRMSTIKNFVYCLYAGVGKRALLLRVTTSKSKNAESFYISKVYINDKGVKGKPLRKKVRAGINYRILRQCRKSLNPNKHKGYSDLFLNNCQRWINSKRVLKYIFIVKLLTRLELVTSALPRRRSTT